jgi:hypothetical protein
MMPDFVTTFGGVGDGSTNNDTAFANAEASAYQRIWLSEGDFYTTRTEPQFSKRYEGPGRIKLSGGSDLQGFAALNTGPSFGTGSEYGETGDTHFSDIEYKEIRAGARVNLQPSQYFQAGATPKFARFYNRGGASGTTAMLAATASVGATTATLNSVEGLAVNDVVGFMQDDNSDPVESVTITAINTTTKQITFTPALATTYTVYGTDYAPTYLTGYAHAPRVSKGHRTMDPYQLVIAAHDSEGDSYIWCGRMIVGYAPKAGQADFFNTATGGLIGGDITLEHDGVYATGWECGYNDQGHDVAVVGRVDNYSRTNDTGARRVTWIHDRAQSNGTKPIDVFYSPAGAGRVGLDLVIGDFSSDGQRAIQMKSQQRIYFDATVNSAAGQRARGYWGNVQGDSWLGHNIDGTGEYVDLWVGNQQTLRIRPSATALTGSLSVTGDITTNRVTANADMVLTANHPLYLNGIGGGVYIIYESSKVVIYRGGVPVASF